MSHERVLVVDDEKLIRFTLRESLAEEGYVVHEAAGVEEARKVCERHRIDCAILDHKLPDGDGFELLETLKEESPDVPVILMTAYSTIQKAVEAMRKGAVTLLDKPVKQYWNFRASGKWENSDSGGWMFAHYGRWKYDAERLTLDSLSGDPVDYFASFDDGGSRLQLESPDGRILIADRCE